jgi:hypothetical protein
MKVTVVPAQVTTVEDRIVGNLSLSQLMLLVAPIFGATVLYVILPPNLHDAPYKLVVMVVLALVCGLLAIRLKGKLVLLWLVVILRYRLRPRYYVFNKNTSVGREPDLPVVASEEETITSTPKARIRVPQLSLGEMARLKEIIEHPAANLTFKTTRKGDLNVFITEIDD